MSQAGVGRFRDLEVWREAIELAHEIYQITRSYPPDERFGLTAQLRSASVSVASNIAEGSTRRSRREFARFIEIALGSLAEVETQLEIAARELKCCKQPSRVEVVRKLLYGLHRSLDQAVSDRQPSTVNRQPQTGVPDV